MTSMNILCLAPVMTKIICEDYYMYARMQERGANIVFVTGRSAGDRARTLKLPAYENEDGLTIHRLYKNPREMLIFPQKRLKKVIEVARRLNPDLILCHLADNMRLAILLQKHLKVPIVLHVEIAGEILLQKFDSWKTKPFRFLVGMPSTGIAYWSWLCEKADAVITSNPPDKDILPMLSKHGKPVYYLPWPAHVFVNNELSSTRDRYRGIYAGNLNPFKNTQIFEWVLPLIFQNTPTKEFIIIGAGEHSQIITGLQERFKGKIKHISQLKRSEVAKLISSSFYAFTPVKIGGWGFISDCWGIGTPLLMFNNIFESEKIDACVAKNGDDLVQKINRLFKEPEFYLQLKDIGFEEYNKRTVDVVSNEFLAILKKTLEEKSRTFEEGSQKTEF